MILAMIRNVLKYLRFVKNMASTGCKKSAFLGDLNNNQIDEISIYCKDIVNEKDGGKKKNSKEDNANSDSVYVFPMCDDDFKKVSLIGEGFDKDLVSGKVLAKFI